MAHVNSISSLSRFRFCCYRKKKKKTVAELVRNWKETLSSLKLMILRKFQYWSYLFIKNKEVYLYRLNILIVDILMYLKVQRILIAKDMVRTFLSRCTL